MDMLRPKFDPAGSDIVPGERQWRVKIGSSDGKKLSPKIVGISASSLRIYDSQGKDLRWEYPIDEVGQMTYDPAFGLFAFVWKRNAAHQGEQIHVYSRKYCMELMEAVQAAHLEFRRLGSDTDSVSLTGSIYKQAPGAPLGSPKALGRFAGRPLTPSLGVKEIPMNGPLLTDPALASPKKSPRSPKTPHPSPKLLSLSKKGKVSRPTFSPQTTRKNPLAKSLDFIPVPGDSEDHYKRF
jgi:hypothetical protein